MTDSQKAAQEIHDSIRSEEIWTITRANGDVLDEIDRDAIMERIRQIIDKWLC